jgi:hypothetical protein
MSRRILHIRSDRSRRFGSDRNNRFAEQPGRLVRLSNRFHLEHNNIHHSNASDPDMQVSEGRPQDHRREALCTSQRSKRLRSGISSHTRRNCADRFGGRHTNRRSVSRHCSSQMSLPFPRCPRHPLNRRRKASPPLQAIRQSPVNRPHSKCPRSNAFLQNPTSRPSHPWARKNQLKPFLHTPPGRCSRQPSSKSSTDAGLA